MIERAVMVLGILGLLLPGVVQASEANDLLNQLSELPGINVVRVNETAYLFVLQPAGNLSVATCCGSLTTDYCGRSDGENCNCPSRSGTCYMCQSCYVSSCCGGPHHVCCYEGRRSGHDYRTDCDYVYCDP